MSILIIAGCAYEIGSRFYSRPTLELAVLPFIFGPTLVLLMLGQFTVLLLLGVSLFYAFVRNKRDWLAGASLLLVVSKPHTTLLFLISVALWVFFLRRWVVLISAGLAFSASSVIAIALNPHIFEQFRQRSILVVQESESYPNLGGVLYSISGLHVLALLPQLAGIGWVFFYWRKHRQEWNWEREGMFVLLVSVTCSYYSYPYDEILALPALITALATGNRNAFALAFVITECGYAAYISNIAGHFGFGYMFLWWTSLGWLAAFLLAKSNLFLRKQNKADMDLHSSTRSG
jgi:hypothetical protein